jgi:hypothetical protein
LQFLVASFGVLLLLVLVSLVVSVPPTCASIMIEDCVFIVAELSVPSHCLLPFVPLSYHAFPE